MGAGGKLESPGGVESALVGAFHLDFNNKAFLKIRK